MTKKIDFDNADIAIVGIVLIIVSLIIVAGTTSLPFSEVVPVVNNLLYVFAALVTPGGLQKIVSKAQGSKRKEQ